MPISWVAAIQTYWFNLEYSTFSLSWRRNVPVHAYFPNSPPPHGTTLRRFRSRQIKETRCSHKLCRKRKWVIVAWRAVIWSIAVICQRYRNRRFKSLSSNSTIKPFPMRIWRVSVCFVLFYFVLLLDYYVSQEWFLERRRAIWEERLNSLYYRIPCVRTVDVWLRAFSYYWTIVRELSVYIVFEWSMFDSEYLHRLTRYEDL